MPREPSQPSQKFRTAGGGDQSVSVNVGALGGEPMPQTRKVPIKTPPSSAKWIGTMVGACMLTLAGGHISGRVMARPSDSERESDIKARASFEQHTVDRLDAVEGWIKRFDGALDKLGGAMDRLDGIVRDLNSLRSRPR